MSHLRKLSKRTADRKVLFPALALNLVRRQVVKGAEGFLDGIPRRLDRLIGDFDGGFEEYRVGRVHHDVQPFFVGQLLDDFVHASPGFLQNIGALAFHIRLQVFRETLELAAEAGTPFAGVLCGRATWQDGIPVYAKEGFAALEAWLEDRGVQNIEALNQVLARGAQPWWTAYGGKEKIQVVE